MGQGGVCNIGGENPCVIPGQSRCQYNSFHEAAAVCNHYSDCRGIIGEQHGALYEPRRVVPGHENLEYFDKALGVWICHHTVLNSGSLDLMAISSVASGSQMAVVAGIALCMVAAVVAIT